jgi:hypothetical protein
VAPHRLEEQARGGLVDALSDVDCGEVGLEMAVGPQRHGVDRLGSGWPAVNDGVDDAAGAQPDAAWRPSAPRRMRPLSRPSSAVCSSSRWDGVGGHLNLAPEGVGRSGLYGGVYVSSMRCLHSVLTRLPSSWRSVMP